MARDSDTTTIENAIEPAIRAPLMRLRLALRRLMPYNTAVGAGDAFARFAPEGLQRLAERQIDFPVSRVIRNAPLLLIRVPRSASVSLALQVYGRVSHVPHRSAVFYRNADPVFFGRALSFAVVRQPLERAESAFRWLKGGEFRRANPNPGTHRSMRMIGSYEEFVFDHLYPAFKAGRLHTLDPVLRYQRDYVCDQSGAIIVKRVFRFDQMHDVQRFLAENGVTASERSENKAPQGILRGRSRAIDDALQVIYAPDIETFGFR